MNTPNTSKPKKPFRKRHLFARSVSEVVREATKPLMHQQGKIYGALLRDWPQIVGAERAGVTRPERLQFSHHTADDGAVLHLNARPSAAPELAYMHEQLLEQCARYFGYRAIKRIVIHPTHDGFADTPYAAESLTLPAEKPAPPDVTIAALREAPSDMRGILERIAKRITSASDKKS